MKQLLALTILSALILTGCSTIQTGPVEQTTAEKIAPAVKTAAFGGSWYALKEHPEWREGFEIALRDLAIIENAEQIDFATILAIVTRLPIDELKSEEATIAITGATILLSGYGGNIVQIDQLQELKPIATALREGIELALQ